MPWHSCKTMQKGWNERRRMLQILEEHNDNHDLSVAEVLSVLGPVQNGDHGPITTCGPTCKQNGALAKLLNACRQTRLPLWSHCEMLAWATPLMPTKASSLWRILIRFMTQSTGVQTAVDLKSLLATLIDYSSAMNWLDSILRDASKAVWSERFITPSFDALLDAMAAVEFARYRTWEYFVNTASPMAMPRQYSDIVCTPDTQFIFFKKQHDGREVQFPPFLKQDSPPTDKFNGSAINNSAAFLRLVLSLRLSLDLMLQSVEDRLPDKIECRQLSLFGALFNGPEVHFVEMSVWYDNKLEVVSWSL